MCFSMYYRFSEQKRISMKKIILTICILLISHRAVSSDDIPTPYQIVKQEGTAITAQVVHLFFCSKLIPDKRHEKGRQRTVFKRIQTIKGGERREKIHFSLIKKEEIVELEASSIETYRVKGFTAKKNDTTLCQDKYTLRLREVEKKGSVTIIRTKSWTVMPSDLFFQDQKNRF